MSEKTITLSSLLCSNDKISITNAQYKCDDGTLTLINRGTASSNRGDEEDCNNPAYAYNKCGWFCENSDYHTVKTCN